MFSRFVIKDVTKRTAVCVSSTFAQGVKANSLESSSNFVFLNIGKSWLVSAGK